MISTIELVEKLNTYKTEYLDFFIDKYGIQKISEFYNLFEEYEKGKITLRTLVDGLRIDASELLWLLHDLGLLRESIIPHRVKRSKKMANTVRNAEEVAKFH